MNLFITWSGDLSKELGQQFKEWLPPVLQSVKPYFSPHDIKKGDKWFSDVSTQLNDTSFGIAMMTPENLENSWIMFEAGACAKKTGIGKFCPILFDVRPVDLKGPLAELQACTFEKNEVKLLVDSLNQSCEVPLNAGLVERCFDTYWPDLEKRVGQVKAKFQNKTPIQERSVNELLEEILMRVRGLGMTVGGSGSGEINSRVVGDLNTIYFYVVDAYNKRDWFTLGSVLEQLYMPISFIANQSNMNFDRPEVKREVEGTTE